MRLSVVVLMLFGILMAGSVAAKADPVPAGTLLASMTVSGTNVGEYKATVKSWVIDTDSALLGLVFAWQVTVEKIAAEVERITVGPTLDWTGWTLSTHTEAGPNDADFDGLGLDGSVAGTQDADSHGLNLGGIPFFNFDVSGLGSVAGEISYILWVQTDADNYQTGRVNLINGGTFQLASFAPDVPEPASMLLLGSGLLGLAGAARRKAKGKKDVKG